MITVQDIINKRKVRWDEKHDLDYDRQLIEASVSLILQTPALRQEIYETPYLLIPIAFYIVDKKRATVPFFFNAVQEDFIRQLETNGTGRPFFILKSRQQGFTSLITAIQLSFAIVRKNFAGFTIADRSDNTQAIFNDKARTVYERLPSALKPHEKFNSKNELFYDKLNSSWRIATATKNVGRSRTLNFVHFSEVAFYECDIADLQKGIGEAITADAFVVYETTANGFNQAKDLWDSGTCINLFYVWYQSAEYRSTEYRYLDTKDPWLLGRIALLKELGLDREQIAWYCKKYNSYQDKSTIKQEYPTTPEEAFVASGDCVFDKDSIANRIASLRHLPAAKCGYFTYDKTASPIKGSDGSVVDYEKSIVNIAFHESADGCIRIHEEPRVLRNVYGDVTHMAPYAIGGDTAGSGTDYFAAKVICSMDEHCAATLHKQYMDEDLYGEQMYCLGKYYHDALIGIEINYSSVPVRVLREYGYPNIYMREKLTGMADRPVMEYGFETTSRTRPIIIGELVKAMRQDPTIECDIPTLSEMLTFVKKQNGRQEAIDGGHDDLVLANAIAHFVSGRQEKTWLRASSDEDRFIEKNFHVEPEQTGGNEFMIWEEF